MSLRRIPFAHLLFALLLLFAQQQAILHALDHDFERIHASTKDATHPDEVLCAKCLAVAHLGHANSGAMSFPTLPGYLPPMVALAVLLGATPVAVRAYHSRAPPIFS